MMGCVSIYIHVWMDGGWGSFVLCALQMVPDNKLC